MTSGFKACVPWLAGTATLVGLLTAPALTARRAQAPAPSQTAGPVDTSLLGGITFRNLTHFSRGGRSTAVAGVVGNEQLYYMGSTGGGVWKTTNAGATWTSISDGFFEAGLRQFHDFGGPMGEPDGWRVGRGWRWNHRGRRCGGRRGIGFVLGQAARQPCQGQDQNPSE